MAYDPALLSAIVRFAPAHLRENLVTTTLIETGGNPWGKPGDNGQSYGAYQEYSAGRGAGLTPDQRRDPVGSTKRAVREFSVFYDRGARGASLAYRAQRPADQADYLRKYAQYAPQARQILAKAGGAVPPAASAPAGRRAGGAAPVGGGGQITPGSIAAVRRYAAQSEADVLAGRLPGDIDAVLSSIQFTGKPANVGRRAAGGGHSAGDGHDHSGEGVPLSGPVGGFSRGGGPEDHGRRALGNWQSDNAYDIMGKAGQAVYSPIKGVVTKVSGQPGGDPGFAGYGITVRTPNGDLFFKHLGSTPLKVGSTISPGALVGTLDAKTAGGPHLHLGGTNRGFLDRLYSRYVGQTR